MRRMITETIPAKVVEDTAFRSARDNSDPENARIEHDRALGRVMTSIMQDDTELFRQFMDTGISGGGSGAWCSGWRTGDRAHDAEWSPTGTHRPIADAGWRPGSSDGTMATGRR